MPRSPHSTTDTYLDALRALGVSDAALHRHHDSGPETPLRVAIDGDRGAPTADLLSALDATGRVLDLRDGLAPGGDRLTAAFARFGLRIACELADGEVDGDSRDSDDTGTADLDLRVLDVVTDRIDSVRTATDAEAVEATLQNDVLDGGPIELVELLDGRHLVAESRELESLAASYGARIEPFDDPLLVPDAAIDTETDESASDDRFQSTTGDAPDRTAPRATETEDGTDSIETALADVGPRRHTIEDDENLAAAASTTDGGPRRTVSTTGIDEVFDQLESSTAEITTGSSTDATHRPPATAESTSGSMHESADSPTDASASSGDADTTPNGLTCGPTRTVSSTSADDILSRATGDGDFEEIAAEEDGADPDAVLADAENVPAALANSETSPKLESAPEAADLADDIHEDAELRRGSESVDGPAPLDVDPGSYDADAGERDAGSDPATTDGPAPADGPLAAADGVQPDRRSADGESDAGAGAERDGAVDDGETDERPGTDADAESGLVGRITSTIFGS